MARSAAHTALKADSHVPVALSSLPRTEMLGPNLVCLNGADSMGTRLSAGRVAQHPEGQDAPDTSTRGRARGLLR